MSDLYAGNFNPHYRKSWALVVGINDYEYTNPLSYARKDAEDIASLLPDLGFSQDCIRLITDRDASRAAILDSYLDYIQIADSPDDRIIVFFAGHGVTQPGYLGQVGYLVPAEGRPEEPASLIRWDQLTRNAELIPAKHMLFILDACFSGLAFKRAQYPAGQRFVSEMLQRRSRQVITAGKEDEVVADGGGPDGKNSIFTGNLLEGLRGAAVSSSGLLTANQLMHHVYERIAEDPRAQQTPHYGHVDGDGDFVLIAPGEASLFLTESDLIIETPPEMPEAPTTPAAIQTIAAFAERNGYLMPNRPDFGRNLYSNRLGNIDFGNNGQEAKALSWLAVVMEPVDESTLAIDVAKEAAGFANFSPQGSEPFERFTPPREVMTTIDSVILFDKLSYESDYWARYVRIDKGGNIEFCESVYSFFSRKDIQAFRYVQVIGMVWQLLFFGKFILSEYGYERGVRLLANLVGTKDTILADFATERGDGNQKWRELGRSDRLGRGEGLLRLKCPDPNLQMEYRLVPATLDEASSRQIIDDVARQLGLAYNHQSEPRCYNYGTDIFPWPSFFNNRR